jgi:hypothetical protein
MHNIYTNYSKFYGFCKELIETDIDSKKSFQFSIAQHINFYLKYQNPEE